MKVLNNQETERLMNVVSKEDPSSRNAMMIRMFLNTGLRVSELSGLIFDDVFLGADVKQYMVVRQAIAKGGRSREIPLSESLRKDLTAYRQGIIYSGRTDAVTADRPLFPRRDAPTQSVGARQIQRMVEVYGSMVGIQKLHPHTLRHTFATNLMRVAGMRTVQALLGHRSLNSTQIYTHPNSDDCRTAVNKLSETCPAK